MLEKNEKFMYFDAHFHISDCEMKENPEDFWKYLAEKGISYGGITCACSKEQFYVQQKAVQKASEYGIKIFQAYGFHPWYLENTDFPFLEELLKAGYVDAVGEAGIDLFTSEMKNTLNRQTEIFERQIELSIRYGKPLIIHGRKSFDQLLAFSDLLKQVPEVLFHSFSGNPVQAETILNRGINAYFSFGNSLLNGNKNGTACAASLPENRIFAETDAPFQLARGGQNTYLKEIFVVSDYINKIRCN